MKKTTNIKAIVILICLATFSVRCQILTPVTSNILQGGSNHENIWTTSILSPANVCVSAINIHQFKNMKRKANAGFLLFPGLLQLSAGVFYKKQDDPTRNIDVAVGTISMLICGARLIYRPKKKENGSTTRISPWYLPLHGAPAFGFRICSKF